MQRVHGKGFEQTDFFSDKPLYINNCGYIKDLASDSHEVRPKGRTDYHIIFNAHGKMIVDGKELKEGRLYLYPPHVKHDYEYLSVEKSIYYWIHFSGYEVSALLSEYGIGLGQYDVEENSYEIEELFRLMIKSFNDGWQCADDYASNLLRAMFPLIISPKNTGSPFFGAMHRLGDISEDISVKELADMYKMSEGHFIRQFRSYVGMTPNSYRIARKLAAAKNMLADTDLSISEIALSINIPDSLYFSRLFTKKIGMSPSEYRKMHSFNV